MDEHVYVDHALNGVGAARPGLANLMAAVVSHHKPFAVILVDDFYKEQGQAERKQKFLELLTKIED